MVDKDIINENLKNEIDYLNGEIIMYKEKIDKLESENMDLLNKINFYEKIKNQKFKINIIK